MGTSNCFIDYRRAPRYWTFDSNPNNPDSIKYFSDLPNKRKYFTNVEFGPEARQFHGVIDWSLDNLTTGSASKWVYDFILDEDYKHISSGTCKIYRTSNGMDELLETDQFGVHLKYQILTFSADGA